MYKGEVHQRERERFIRERKKFIRERKRFIRERKRFIRERKRFIRERKRFIRERKRFIRERKRFIRERERFIRERNRFIRERNRFIRERNRFIRERERFIGGRGSLEREPSKPSQYSKIKIKVNHTCISLSLSNPSLMLSMNFPNKPLGFGCLFVDKYLAFSFIENETKNLITFHPKTQSHL